MGLDFLDITFRIEKTFDVKISQEDALGLVRDRDIMVGDLYDLVLRKLRLRDVARNDIRLNYAVWTDLQVAIHSVTEVPLDRIELKTKLAALFPRKTRRSTWETLREASPYRIRKLDYPRFARVIGFALAVGMALVEQLHLWQIPGVKWLWPMLGLLGIWMLAETYAKVLSILSPLRQSFPSGMTTVKDLCRAVLGTNYEELCRDVAIPFDERCLDVWRQLTEILVDALGVDADEVTFRTHLVRDLAMS